MKKILAITVVFLTVILAVPLAAQAYSYSKAYFDNDNKKDLGELTADGMHYTWAPASDFSVKLVEEDDATTWVKAYCIEPNQDAALGGDLSTEVELTTLDNVTGGLEAAWLFDYAYGDYGSDSTSYSEAELNGALQLAIWEVITEDDGNYDLYTGDFFIGDGSKANVDLTNSYLAALETNFASADLTYLSSNYVASLNDEYQDLILRYDGFTPAGGMAPTTAPTPEPASMLLLAFGLFGLAGLKRKFS